jgi:hypothetical protein
MEEVSSSRADVKNGEVKPPLPHTPSTEVALALHTELLELQEATQSLPTINYNIRSHFITEISIQKRC